MGETRFHFRALDAEGRLVSGTLKAADVDSAAADIRARGHMPVRVDPGAAKAGLMALLEVEITPRRVLSLRDRVTFLQALATLLTSGIAMDQALRITADLGETKPIRAIAKRLLGRVSEGVPLGDAMASEGKAFPEMTLGIVRAAEASGSLGPALLRLSQAEDAAVKRQAALRSALIYPAFLVVTAILCIGVLLAFVVPTFQPMLEAAGRAPPRSTQIVLAIAGFAQNWGPVLLPLAFVMFAVLQALLRRPGPRVIWHHLLLALPVMGPLRRKFSSATLARILGEQLAGGVDLQRALRLSQEGLGDAAIRAEVASSLARVEAGERLAAVFGGSLLSPLVVQLMDVGERTGTLPAMLNRAADILDDQARVTLDRLIGLLTPVITLVMGLVIGLIVTSILFALFSLNELAL